MGYRVRTFSARDDAEINEVLKDIPEGGLHSLICLSDNEGLNSSKQYQAIFWTPEDFKSDYDDKKSKTDFDELSGLL